MAKGQKKKDYYMLSAKERLSFIFDNYRNFDKVLNGQKETLVFLVSCEREYNRHSKAGDVGVRVQSSGIFSDPTANNAIERYEIDQTINDSDYSEEFFKDINDREYILAQIWNLKLMQLEYRQLQGKIRNLNDEERYILDAYLNRQKNFFELAEEYSVEPDSVKQRVYRIRKQLNAEMLIEMKQYASITGGQADENK